MSRAQLTSTDQQNSGGAVSPFLAGKNKIINGDFAISQRGQSFTSPSFSTYTLDRWRNNNYDVAPTTWSVSQVAFDYSASPATDKLPISGYSGTYFYRSTITTVGSNTAYDTCSQRVEGIPFSNQTVTISFWAKSDSTRTQKFYAAQTFGSGGSGEYAFIGLTNFTTTTSWQRFVFTATIPSIAGYTIGTNPYIYNIIRQASASGSVLDVWGYQMEAGSVATPFTTASNTLQGELALCSRYYYASDGTQTAGYSSYNTGNIISNSFPFPVKMRIAPSVNITDTASNAGKVTIYPAGGTAQTNITPAGTTTISTDQWRFLQGALGGTPNNSGILACSYVASAEL